MGAGSTMVLILLLALVAGSAYVLYDNWPRESIPLDIPFIPSVPHTNVPSGSASRSAQFYPNLRFPSEEISYRIDSACSADKETQVGEAMEILSDQTPLVFSKTTGSADLEITCSELAPEPSMRNHFIAGEGGPTTILNGSRYSLIMEGKISLYRDETCDSPHIALHELLHVLGFDHNSNQNSILYPTLDCDQVLDSYLISDLNELYSVPSEAELAFSAASGSRSGKYLSFEATIENQGLAPTDSLVLRVEADGVTVKDFDLEEIPLGTKKVLTISNLNVGRSAQIISLVLDPENRVPELDEGNNRIELT